MIRATLLLAVLVGGIAVARAQPTPLAERVPTPAADVLSLHGVLLRLEDEGLTPAVKAQWDAFDSNWPTAEGRTEETAAAVLTTEIGWVFETNTRRDDATRLVLPILGPLGKLPAARQREVMEKAISHTERARLDRHSLTYISLFPGGARDAILDWHLANSTVSEALTMEALIEQKLHGTGTDYAEARLLNMAQKYLPPDNKRDLTSFEIQSLFVKALLGDEPTRKATRERFARLAASLDANDPRAHQVAAADENLSRPPRPRVPKVVEDYQAYRAALKPDEAAITFSDFQAKWASEHSTLSDFGIEEAPLPGS